MADRWIKYHPDRFDKWRWKDSPLDVRMLHLIAKEAQSLPGVNHGVQLQPGELVMSRLYIQNALGVSDRQVRTLLKHVQETGQIATSKATKLGMVYMLLPQAIFTISIAESDQVNDHGSDQNKRKKRDSGGKHQPLTLVGATTNKEKEHDSSESETKEKKGRFLR